MENTTLSKKTVEKSVLEKDRGVTITEVFGKDNSIPYIKQYRVLFEDNPINFYDKPKSKYHK